MDVRESEKVFPRELTVETARLPLIPADKNNEATRRSRTKQVSSRYKSPTPSAPRRFPSPNITRTATTSTQLVPKRAISAERKRPSTPPSPARPSTPVQDTSTDVQLASRKVLTNKQPEGLWPSTMRSLSVSFQSDSFSLPITKKEKPVPQALSDRALKPSSNVARKQAESVPVSRKSTPERKRSPVKGKNAPDQSENSKPVEGLRTRLVDQHTRLVDQHRWPSRASVKGSSHVLSRSVDFTEKMPKRPASPNVESAASSLRRMSLPGGMTKPLQKSSSDAATLVKSDDSGKMELELHSVDNIKLQEHKPVSSRFLDRTILVSPAVRSQSLSIPGSRPQSPNRASTVSSSVSRGVSPIRTKLLNPISRGPSPSRSRPSSPSRQSSSSTSVLTFTSDIRGKKAVNHIEDVHQLRLLYNRQLQWRFANARADAVLHRQKLKTETTLYNVWRTTSELRDSVTEKRMDLQQLRVQLKLFTVLNEQVDCLEDWAAIERDHMSSLTRATQDLQSSTLRVPVTGGARADLETMKGAICSAVDVMQAMGSSLSSVLSTVEGMNCLVSDLADVASRERAMLDECEALMASTIAMQIEEYSLRTHLIQLKQASSEDEQMNYQ